MGRATGPRLVMLSATSPGAGKSSVMAELATRVSPPVIEIKEDDVWGRRELGDRPVDVLTAREDFRRVVFRGASDDFVTLITRLFAQLVADCISASSIWMQDWTWPDLVRLGWRTGSDQEVQTVSAHLRSIAEPVRPLIVQLVVDPDLALRRAVEERGEVWFNRHFGRELSLPVEAVDIQAGAARYAADGERRLAVLRDAGWYVVPVDGDQGLPDVAADALAVLQSTLT